MPKKIDAYRRDATSDAYHGFYANAVEALSLMTLSKDPKCDGALKETLLKSCLVLLVACWESFIEDLLRQSMHTIITHAKSPDDLPKLLKRCVANDLKNDNHDFAVWDLAEDGWKNVLMKHIEKNIAGFHNPKASNIDVLFKTSLGLENLSSSWESEQLNTSELSLALKKMIEQRGEIAHTVKLSQLFTEADLNTFGWVLIILSGMTINCLRQYIIDIVKVEPWPLEQEDQLQGLIGRYRNG